MYPRALEHPFNHLDSTSSELPFPRILAHNFYFSLFTVRRYNITRVKARISHEHAELPNLTTPETYCPAPYTMYLMTR